jgi:hypothetical protein
MTEEKKGGQENETRPVFNPEGVRRLLEAGGGEDLNDDERALLLALVGAERAAGRELSGDEMAALEKLRSQVEGYDIDELTQAITHMVGSESRESRKMKWPDVKIGRRKKS